MIRINLLPAEDAARAAGRRHDIARSAPSSSRSRSSA